MARTITITWTLTAEEHAAWLSQARRCGLSVGDYVYVLAVLQQIESYPLGTLPRTLFALRRAFVRVRWYRTWRQGRKR